MEQALREYDPKWRDAFEQERMRLLSRLSGVAREILHVGSTAIPGMPGKGIIDILMVVDSLDPQDAYAVPLLDLGYISRPVPERPESPFFTRPAVKPRSHNLHVAIAGSKRVKSLLAFRDYLRADPAAAQRYAEAKRGLARGNRIDLEAYSGGKAAVAAALEQEAVAWAGARDG